MSTPIPPGGPTGNRPYGSFDQYYVEKIEDDPLSEHPTQKNAPPSAGQCGWMAFIAKRLAECFDLLVQDETAPIAGRNLSKNLHAFKEALDTLLREDCSQNFPFLNRFSETWNALLEDATHLGQRTPLGKALHQWIKQIHSHPTASAYSLGYYLSEYAGHAWLPFPYLELIQTLHIEQIQLQRWSQELSHVLTLLT